MICDKKQTRLMILKSRITYAITRTNTRNVTYNNLGITVTASVALIPFNHSLPFTTIKSTTRFSNYTFICFSV